MKQDVVLSVYDHMGRWTVKNGPNLRFYPSKSAAVDAAVATAKRLHANGYPVVLQVTGEPTRWWLGDLIEEKSGPATTRRTTAAKIRRGSSAKLSYKAKKNAGNFARRGTGHIHPPGPRKCPKCGV